MKRDPIQPATHPLERHYLDLTRRRFFGKAAATMGAGLGGLALASMLGNGPTGTGSDDAARAEAMFRAGTHFAPKAKRVICMHMEGAPSQIDLYDHKPLLNEMNGNSPSGEMGPMSGRGFGAFENDSAWMWTLPR